MDSTLQLIIYPTCVVFFSVTIVINTMSYLYYYDVLCKQKSIELWLAIFMDENNIQCHVLYKIYKIILYALVYNLSLRRSV